MRSAKFLKNPENGREWLLNQLDRLGWATNKLAKKSGVSQSSISRFLSGTQTNMDMQTWERIINFIDPEEPDEDMDATITAEIDVHQRVGDLERMVMLKDRQIIAKDELIQQLWNKIEELSSSKKEGHSNGRASK